MVARGSNQREASRRLWEGQAIHNFAFGLKGRAGGYRGRYDASFRAMIARVRDAGFEVVVRRGVRGGETSATYTMRRYDRGVEGE